MNKIINPIYLPNNMRMIDNKTTVNIDVSTQTTTNNIIDGVFIEQYPYYKIEATDRLINIVAGKVTTPYDYTAIGTGATEYNDETAYPNGVSAKYNRKILQLELPQADETESMILWINASRVTGDWIVQVIPTIGDTILGNPFHLKLTESEQVIGLLLTEGQWSVISAYNISDKQFIEDTDIQTGNYTASSFENVLCNSTGGTFTIKFPTNPTHLDEMSITDVAGSCNTNVIALSGEGNKINNSTSPFIIDVDFSYVSFKFIGDSFNNWIVKEIPNTI